jgi:hypothetical protein
LPAEPPKPRRKAGLLGLGLDDPQGHTRVTRGENFHLVGGSKQTHEQMQEQCIKFNEKLKSRGKPLESLERQEFLDLARECEMNVLQPPRGREERS